MTEKVTIMVLKVDLQCPCCYKKVKKLLCKYPQIRDQVYDEKQNTVTITVVCCSPEKIRDKLCCKGGKVIKSIEIKPPPKTKEPEKLKAPEKPKPTELPKAVEKPKDLEKPKSNGKPAEKPPPANKPANNVPVLIQVQAPKAPEPAPGPPQPGPIAPAVMGHGYPSIFPYEACCGPCSEGLLGGPCNNGYVRPVACYDSYGYNNYGYESNGGRRHCYISPCDYEENTPACTIM